MGIPRASGIFQITYYNQRNLPRKGRVEVSAPKRASENCDQSIPDLHLHSNESSRPGCIKNRRENALPRLCGDAKESPFIWSRPKTRTQGREGSEKIC